MKASSCNHASHESAVRHQPSSRQGSISFAVHLSLQTHFRAASLIEKEAVQIVQRLAGLELFSSADRENRGEKPPGHCKRARRTSTLPYCRAAPISEKEAALFLERLAALERGGATEGPIKALWEEIFLELVYHIATLPADGVCSLFMHANSHTLCETDAAALECVIP